MKAVSVFKYQAAVLCLLHRLARRLRTVALRNTQAVTSDQNPPKAVNVNNDAKMAVTTSAAVFINGVQLLDVTTWGGGGLVLLLFFLVDIVNAG